MDKPNTIPWPPIIYFTAIIIGVVLNYLLPLPYLLASVADGLYYVGIILIIIAILIDVLTFRELSKHRTTVMPHKSASNLVTSGTFGFSRNPIYLSNTMIVVGLFLMLQNTWLLISAFGAAFFTHHMAILREERHLLKLFGQEWIDYTNKVRRWI